MFIEAHTPQESRRNGDRKLRVRCGVGDIRGEITIEDGREGGLRGLNEGTRAICSQRGWTTAQRHSNTTE